jgi:ribose transport system substrate-binding protein
MRLLFLVFLSITVGFAGPALAAKKQLTVVLGGLDNPFFQDIANGCAQWTKDHADSDYECVAVGPKKSSKGADELKLLQKAIDDGAAAIAVAPATEGIPDLIRKSGTAIPIMTIAGDFPEADQPLRKSWLTSDDYDMGVALGAQLAAFKPAGGSVCFEQNNPEARNINNRAAGIRDTLSGVPGTAVLAGEKGWTEVEGCPLYNKDDVGVANKQLVKLLKDNPKIDAVVLVGGWAMFDAKAFTKSVSKVKDRLADKSLIIISGDTLPMQIDALKAGRVHALVGQSPVAMGKIAPDLMIKLINGEEVPPKVTAPVVLCTAETVDTCLAP